MNVKKAKKRNLFFIKNEKKQAREKKLKKIKKMLKKTKKTLDKNCEIDYYIQALFESV